MGKKFDALYTKIISQMNEDIMRAAGAGEWVDNAKKGICPSCKQPVDQTQLRDQPSKKQFKISGLCQACQDQIFSDPEDQEDYSENLDKAGSEQCNSPECLDGKCNQGNCPTRVNPENNEQQIPEDFKLTTESKKTKRTRKSSKK